MASINSLKRHLLRAVVQENVDILQQYNRRGFQRHAHRPSLVQEWLRRVLVTGTLVSFVALFYVVTGIVGDYGEATDLSPALVTGEGTDSPSFPTKLAHRSSAKSLALPMPEQASPQVLSPEPPLTDLTAFPLAVKKVVIDPGHGGTDPGAVAASGLVEKAITLDIGQRLRSLLEESSLEVLMTREEDETVPLAQRAAVARSQGGDIFISIHINWVDTPQTRIVETYYLGPSDDPISLQRARMENHQSGYSLADFRRLLNGIYFHATRNESRKLAETIQDELYRSLREANPRLKNRGVKTAPFLVLVATEMPAILTEVSCLSNPDEARLLAKPEYRQQVAQALFRGIRTYADVLSRSTTTGG